ncbi:MAG: electron transfer flavoprotein subunit alpha/FixB family protein [Deltaproteobacteria bacterium]|jgi:electron transfer flavoprotein alpha subunit|nr:electron transfer flavoprotein subunit alpha/FixB family protein [Deltaproteobacteria bacterium]
MVNKVNKAILVWLEVSRGKLTGPSRNLARLAGDLARQANHKLLGALMVGHKTLPTLNAFGGLNLSKVFIFKGRPRATIGEKAAALTKAAKLACPEIILVAADQRGREMAPMVAAKLGTGLTADCTGLRLEKGLLVQTRPAFGGDLMAEIVTPEARPQMATVRVSSQPPQEAINGPVMANSPDQILFPTMEMAAAPRVYGDTRVLKRSPLSLDDDLEKAEVVVACGLGVGGPQGLARAQSLADKLGASLGGTRAVVDQGWLPAHRQIGLSGREINPNLLIALGLSGSVQFMAGAAGAKDIIAVNSDPMAPILALARVGLIIDLEELWPELEEALDLLV